MKTVTQFIKQYMYICECIYTWYIPVWQADDPHTLILQLFADPLGSGSLLTVSTRTAPAGIWSDDWIAAVVKLRGAFISVSAEVINYALCVTEAGGREPGDSYLHRHAKHLVHKCYEYERSHTSSTTMPFAGLSWIREHTRVGSLVIVRWLKELTSTCKCRL